MKKGKASRTAQYMALFRALESKKPIGTRIFEDPYAKVFLERKLRWLVKISSMPFAGWLIQRRIQAIIPGAFSSGVARTKYIDDLILKTIKNGVGQVIILGAGFDTRSIRLKYLKNISIVEIDHPDTSKVKISKLREAVSELPANTTYIQLDFNTARLEETARKHALDFSIPTTILWEGVTNYLTEEAVSDTFKFVAKFTRGSYVIFTYVNKDVMAEPQRYYGGQKLLSDLEEIEERWTFGLMPDQVPAYLERFSLKLVEDLGAIDYRKRYLPGSDEKGYEFYRVAFAKI